MREAVHEVRLSLVACLSRDPKTLAMRADLLTPFGAEAAAWKGELLRHHRSQHQRNLKARGHGIDARILEVNRASAGALGLQEEFAEVFELEPFGGAEPRSVMGDEAE
jgi:hypothetical protein